jgi:hypothetical protein
VLTALIGERVDRRLARWLLGPLVAVGVVSVFYWYWSELRGAGDLRLYVIVQFGSLLVVALLLALYKSPYTGSAYLVAGLIVYGAAKLFELADRPIFAIGGIVSGHTLKHLVAAAGGACIVRMLQVRTPRGAGASAPASASRAGQ